jgi:hypothetical protein
MLSFLVRYLLIYLLIAHRYGTELLGTADASRMTFFYLRGKSDNFGYLFIVWILFSNWIQLQYYENKSFIT